MRVTMRRNATASASSHAAARDVDLEKNASKGKGFASSRVDGIRGGRGRRCCRIACSLLCASVVFGLVVAAVKIKPLADSYGYEVPYFLVVPLWVRWLTEKPPHVIVPAVVHEEVDDPERPPVEGAEKFGDMWISRVASKPNITIVHNFLSKRDCEFLRKLADKMGMLPANRFKVGNDEGGSAVTLNSFLDAVYNIVRTSKGEFVEFDRLEPDELETVLKYVRRAEQLTGLHMGNFEPPFLQYYQPNNVFRAHYGERKPSPARERFTLILPPLPQLQPA